ncbi:MAG: hypothetical protein WKF84_22470 [Pyrinomonadaceae bacterium]
MATSGQAAEVSAAGRYNEGVAWTPNGESFMPRGRAELGTSGS